jgi:hypothetical protein
MRYMTRALCCRTRGDALHDTCIMLQDTWWRVTCHAHHVAGHVVMRYMTRASCCRTRGDALHDTCIMLQDTW